MDRVKVNRKYGHDYIFLRADKSGKCAMRIVCPHDLYVDRSHMTISYPDGNCIDVSIIDHGNGKITLRIENDKLRILSTYDQLLEVLTK